MSLTDYSEMAALENDTASSSTASLSSYKRRAWKLCREYLHGSWANIAKEELEFTRISGGLSNHIFRCSLPRFVPLKADEPKEVLLRIYGANEESTKLRDRINNHIIDNVVFTILSERGLGPRLYGVFPEGRLEEFIPARSMEPHEVMEPSLSEIIAIKVAKIHALRAPINKETKWLEKMMAKYTNAIQQLSLAHVAPEFHEMANNLLCFNFVKEVEWLMDFLSRVHSPIVFCHNDIQGGNILMKKDSCGREDKLMIIDYEFCGYNYRGHDIANHFLEWMYDYTVSTYPYYSREPEKFPTKEKQMSFFHAYLSTQKNLSPLKLVNLLEEDEGTRQRTRSTSGCSSSNSSSSNGVMRKRHLSLKAMENQSAEVLYREVQAFLLAPSLLWCMWAMIHSTNEKIPFGYWEYATDRMEEYRERKETILRMYNSSGEGIIGNPSVIMESNDPMEPLNVGSPKLPRKN